jgi:membrane-bound metal-dependent hydrolase YbcI (DUF457 family)
MFIGHWGVGLALKRAAPTTSLGILLVASQFLDLLWPMFVLAGWERVRIDPGNTAFTPLDFESYPLTHSLLLSCVWAALVAGVYYLATRRGRVAGWLAVGVVSHWVLDFITHRPDLPLTPGAGSARVGLGLWNSIPGTLVVETAIFAAGVVLYARTTRARDRIGSIGFAAFVIVLLLIYAANLLGPPPPSAKGIGVAGLLLWLFPLWGWWFDRHRRPIGTAGRASMIK